MYRTVAIILLVLGCVGELGTLLVRNIFGVQPDWTVELNTLFLVFGSLLFIGEVESHIAFKGIADAAALRFPWMRKVSYALSGAVMAVMIVLGIQVVQQQAAIGSGTGLSVNIPMWLIYLVVPVSALFGLLRSMQHLMEKS